MAFAASTGTPDASATVTFEASELLERQSDFAEPTVAGRLSFACRGYRALESLELILTIAGPSQNLARPFTRLLMLFPCDPVADTPWPTFLHRPWNGEPHFVEPLGCSSGMQEEPNDWKTAFLRLPFLTSGSQAPRLVLLGLRWYEWPESRSGRLRS